MDRLLGWGIFWGSLMLVLAFGVACLYALAKWWLGGPGREQERLEQEILARDRARYAAEQKWVESRRWPLTHYDVYETDGELTNDLARLKALSYEIEWQEHTENGIAVTYSLTPAYEREASDGQPSR